MIKLLDILLEEKQEKYHILKQLRSPEERKKNYLIATQQKIQQYIKDGSKGYLDLRGTPITFLPNDLTVGGGLDLEDTPITSLPDNLTVGGYLYLNGTPITSLPDNLKVGGSLYLRNTPLSKTHTVYQIRQMAPGVKGRIILK